MLAEVVIEHATLYHGSATGGITELDIAEEDTVGSGVYLAGRPTALGYALHRSRYEGTPVVYRVEIERARLVDLTDPQTVEHIMTGYRNVLEQELRQQTAADGFWVWIVNLNRMIEDIDNGSATKVGHIKIVTQRSGELFTEYLQDLGYDGVATIEGGEGEIGNHHTFLLFEPGSVQITAEEPIAGPDAMGPSTRPAPPGRGHQANGGRPRYETSTDAPTALIKAAFPRRGGPAREDSDLVPPTGAADFGVEIEHDRDFGP